MTAVASTVFGQIMIMFLLLLIGLLCNKINVIDLETNKKLSNLVLMIINPMVIFVAYQRDFETKLLKGLLLALFLALLSHIIGIIISHLCLRNKKEMDRRRIEQFAVIYSNCGFMGIPLVNGVLGSEGVFYVTAYVTVFNLLIWTHGVSLMSNSKDPKTMLKSFVSPTMFAIVLGLSFFLLQIRIPGVLLETAEYVAGMNTPMAMIVAGVMIGQVGIKKLFLTIRSYYVAFLRLLLVPLVTFLCIGFFGLPEDVVLTVILVSACPVGATINLFALRYNKDSLYSTELFALTTILSLVTIPAVVMIVSFLMG